jgi:hypothetical protein
MPCRCLAGRWRTPAHRRISAAPAAPGRRPARHVSCAAVGGTRLELDVLDGGFACARLGAGDPVPPWANDAALSSVTRTAHELSVICPMAAVPEGVRWEGPFRALAVRGPLDFGAVGVLVSLADPLADAGISILAISTFDTDLVLVPEAELTAAAGALGRAGHVVAPGSPPGDTAPASTV